MAFSDINTFHADLFKINFSNIPTISDPDDLSLLENYVRSCNLPEYGMDIDNSEMLGYQIQHPVAWKSNINLGLLQIEFKLSENLRNYLYLFTWIRQVKTGQATGIVRKFYCNDLSIIFLDNDKRPTGRFTYSNVFCIGLSALPLVFGTAEEVSFNATFSYEQTDFILEEDKPPQEYTDNQG